MGLTIKQIRQNTTRARHLMQRTRAQGFAVGAYNIDNQETLIAVARAAQKMDSPSISAHPALPTPSQKQKITG